MDSKEMASGRKAEAVGGTQRVEGDMVSKSETGRASAHPDRRATGPQISYLRRLLNEAFSKRIETCYDVHHLDRVTIGEASAEISRLRALMGIGQ